MRPLNSRVILRQEEADEMTSGGLFVPDEAKRKPTIGVVVHVDEDAPVQLGDRVLFEKYAGHEIEWEGESLLFVDVSELLAVIE